MTLGELVSSARTLAPDAAAIVERAGRSAVRVTGVAHDSRAASAGAVFVAIRGQRTVMDTTTGEKQSVDLGNVDGIVNKLNVFQPGRYQQIPLRDE